MATVTDHVITVFELVDRYSSRLRAIGAQTAATGALMQKTNASALAKLKSDLVAAGTHFSRASTAFHQGWQMIGKASHLARSVAIRLSLIAAAFTAIGITAIRAGARFEASLVKVEALTGRSRKQTELWGRELLEVAGRIGRAPQDLAEGLYFLASAGVKNAEIMQVLTAVSKAAATGLGEAKDIALLTGAAMNAFAQNSMTAERAIDVLIATVREGLAMPEELAQTMGRVLPVAATLGVLYEDVGAAIAAMTRKGLDAAEAVTALRALLVTLVKPSKAAEEALAAAGLSAAGLRAILAEQGLLPMMRALTEGLNRLEKAGVDLEIALGSIFPNVRALVGVLNLMAGDAAETQGIFDRLRQSAGDLDRAFAATQRTLAFRWSQFVAGVQVTFVQLGLALKDAIMPALDTIAAGLRWLIETNVIGESFGKLVSMLNVDAVRSPLVMGIVYLQATIRALPDILRILAKNMKAWLDYLAGWAKAVAAVFATIFAVHVIRGVYHMAIGIIKIAAALKVAAAAGIALGKVIAAVVRDPKVWAGVAAAVAAGVATYALLPKVPEVDKALLELRDIEEFRKEGIEAALKEFEAFREGLRVPALGMPPGVSSTDRAGRATAAADLRATLEETVGGPIASLSDPMRETAQNTAKIARNTAEMIDFRRYALGGGALGAIGVTPVEMGRRVRDIRIRIEGGSDLERWIVASVLNQLRQQGVL